MKKLLTQKALFKCLKDKISYIPNWRSPNRTTHSIGDAIKVLFSAFFLHSKSLNNHIELLSSTKGKRNKKLFGINKIPSANHVRNLIDPIETSHFVDVQDAVIHNMQRSGLLKEFKMFQSQWGYFISIDGFEFFRSENITCKHCNKVKHSDGTVDYFHRALSVGLVHPNENIFLPFSQEFIVRQDGDTKEDCERNAVKRWIKEFRRRHPQMKGTILADALHANQPFLELLLKRGLNFLIVCKPGSNSYLFEWIDLLRKGRDLFTFTRKYRKGKHFYKSVYEYANDVPIRDTDDALRVGFVMETIYRCDTGNKVGSHSFISNLRFEDGKSAEMGARYGRKRWKSENEGHNTWKNLGYHIKHNYGHGKERLSNNTVVICLLAVMMHVVLAFVKQEGFGLFRHLFKTLHACIEAMRAAFRLIGCRNWDNLYRYAWEGFDTS